MQTARTAKIQAEIDKARSRLIEQQARVKELEAKKTEIENLEIVEMVRRMNIPLENLSSTLQSLKGGVKVAANTSGQVGPKQSAKNTNETED